MEPTTKTTPNQQPSTAFIPIPDLEKMSVGHAGLYPADADDNTADADNEIIDVKTAKVVSADITLGIKGGKTLIACEKGIKSFVQDVLAGDKTNHLPNTELGVWIYYLTEGIARDFNRTWETTPYALSKKQSNIARAKAKGKRVLTKAEKNKLLASRNFDYYEKQIADGEITTQDAVALMIEAVERVKAYEAEGLYLSPKKTDGVMLFNSKKEVLDANGREDGYKLYTKNMLEVMVPNLVENFFSISVQERLEKQAKEVKKTSFPCGVYSNIQELMEVLKKEKAHGPDFNKIEQNYIIDGVHLVKTKKSGMMKDRWLCFDCTNKKTNEQ
jgi:hypothetical protein